jgi:hypothetical protein
LQNCEKDDTFKFGSEGNLTINRNADKCDQNELQTEIQNYVLNRTTKEFVILEQKFTLAEESDSQIKYFTPIPTNTVFQ